MALEGLMQGLQAGIARNEDIRKERQQRLKNYVEGFELNKQTGEYEPNNRGMLALANQEEQLKQQLMMNLQQTKILADMMSARGMTEATAYLLAGQASDAQKVLNTNPILKQRLNQAFGVHTILDFDIDRDIAQIERDLGIKIDRSKLNNPEVRQAFKSAFFKAVMNNGDVKIVPTEGIVRSSGFNQYVDTATEQAALEKLKRMKEILSGVVKTPDEQQMEKAVTQANTAKANYVTNVMPSKGEADKAKLDLEATSATKQLEEMEKWFKENPDKTYTDYLAYIQSKQAVADPTKQTKLAKDLLDIQKKQQDIEKGKYDIEKAKLGVEKTKAEIDKIKATIEEKTKGKQSVAPDEYEFITNLDITTPLNRQTYAKAKDIEARNKKLGLYPNADDFKAAAQLPQLAKTINRITKKIDKLPKNAWEKVKTDLQKVTGVFNLYGDDKEAVAKHLQKIKFDSELRSFIRDYVKYMSGAQVTDQEFKGYKDVIVAGDWSTKESAKAALEAFSAALTDKAISRLDNIKAKAPFSYLQYKKPLEEVFKPAKKQSKPSVQQVNTQSQGYYIETPPPAISDTNSSKKRPPLEAFKM